MPLLPDGLEQSFPAPMRPMTAKVARTPLSLSTWRHCLSLILAKGRVKGQADFLLSVSTLQTAVPSPDELKVCVSPPIATLVYTAAPVSNNTNTSTRTSTFFSNKNTHRRTASIQRIYAICTIKIPRFMSVGPAKKISVAK